MRQVRKQDGFTLIELIVVVAILGILAAVVTPRVLNALSDAKETSAEAFGKEIQLAMERYYVDEGHYPGSDSLSAWQTAIGGYINIDMSNIDSSSGSTSNYDYTAADPSKDVEETYEIILELIDSGMQVTVTPTAVTVAPLP